jgi:stearoyl-CoA desaturase (delta-9 desaturase)
VFTKQDDDAAAAAVPDLTAYPELRWLSRHQYFPATVLGVGCWLLGGWTALIVGFFWSTVILYHVTFMINSLAHVHGSKRYVTGDDSRNNWWLALLTLGEGWHNNHHAYMASTRQGFRWWEVDITYYVLKVLSWLGLVWDLNEPPRAIVANVKPLSRGVLDRVANQLAASYPVSQITARTHDAWLSNTRVPGSWDNAPTEAELRTLAARTTAPEHRELHQVHFPHIPSMDEIRTRARQMFATTPALEDIALRARGILVTSVCAGLVRRF